jgi:hypothetical protein
VNAQSETKGTTSAEAKHDAQGSSADTGLGVNTNANVSAGDANVDLSSDHSAQGSVSSEKKSSADAPQSKSSSGNVLGGAASTVTDAASMGASQQNENGEATQQDQPQRSETKSKKHNHKPSTEKTK